MRCLMLLCVLVAGCSGEKGGPPRPMKDKPSASSDSVVARLNDDLRSKDSAKRLQAAKTARKMGPKAAGTARALCEASLDKNPDVSAAALEALERVRADLYPLATGVLKNPKGKKSDPLKAIAALGGKGEPLAPIIQDQIRERIPRTQQDLKDSNESGRLAQAIAAVAPADPISSQLLAELAVIKWDDSNGNAARVDIAASIGSVLAANATSHRVLIPALLKMLKENDQHRLVRIQAVRSIGRAGKAGREALPLIRQLKLDADAEVREAAAEVFKLVSDE